MVKNLFIFSFIWSLGLIGLVNASEEVEEQEQSVFDSEEEEFEEQEQSAFDSEEAFESSSEFEEGEEYGDEVYEGGIEYAEKNEEIVESKKEYPLIQVFKESWKKLFTYETGMVLGAVGVWALLRVAFALVYGFSDVLSFAELKNKKGKVIGNVPVYKKNWKFLLLIDGVVCLLLAYFMLTSAKVVVSSHSTHGGYMPQILLAAQKELLSGGMFFCLSCSLSFVVNYSPLAKFVVSWIGLIVLICIFCSIIKDIIEGKFLYNLVKYLFFVGLVFCGTRAFDFCAKFLKIGKVYSTYPQVSFFIGYTRWNIIQRFGFVLLNYLLFYYACIWLYCYDKVYALPVDIEQQEV